MRSDVPIKDSQWLRVSCKDRFLRKSSVVLAINCVNAREYVVFCGQRVVRCNAAMHRMADMMNSSWNMVNFRFSHIKYETTVHGKLAA